jgi:two-component system response regulator HydG
MLDAPKVLIVDDDAGMCDTMCDILKSEGFQAISASSGHKAIEKCAQNHYDLVLLDIHMPGMDGVETLRAIKRLDTQVRVIMITGFEGEEAAAQAMEAGAEAVFRKPLDVASFLPLLLLSI